jgi:hypothetical protein
MLTNEHIPDFNGEQQRSLVANFEFQQQLIYVKQHVILFITFFNVVTFATNFLK